MCSAEAELRLERRLGQIRYLQDANLIPVRLKVNPEPILGGCDGGIHHGCDAVHPRVP